MSKRPRRDSSSSPARQQSHDPETLPDFDQTSSKTQPVLASPQSIAYSHTTKYTRSSTSPPPPARSPPTTNSNSNNNTMPPIPNTNTNTSTITCTLPTCPNREHTTLEAYESHYQKYHINRCHECYKNFPTGRILECHIRENHDMFAVVKKEKGEKIYACFVEDCDKVCISHGKRRAHLIDKHYYHKNFNFYIVNDGIDRATSLLCASPPQRKSRTRVRRVSESSASVGGGGGVEDGRRKGVGGKEEETEDVEMGGNESPTASKTSGPPPANQTRKRHSRSVSEPQIPAVKEARVEHNLPLKQKVDTTESTAKPTTTDEDMDMADLTSRMSAVRFVPPSVRFGRRGAGFSKK